MTLQRFAIGVRARMAARFALGALLLDPTVLNAQLTAGFRANRQPDADVKAAASAQSAIERIALADGVLAYARERRSAIGYLVASDLYQSVRTLRPVQAGERGLSVEMPGFWEEAIHALAGNRWALGALDQARSSQNKGAIGGPLGFQLSSGSGMARTFRYRAAEPATIYVRPTEVPVRIVVFDQNGAVICRTEQDRSGSLCRWTPLWTGPFRIALEGDVLEPVQLLST